MEQSEFELGEKVIYIDLAPMAKPRMTRKDKWHPRDSVKKYWSFKDEFNLKMKLAGQSDLDLTYCGFTFVIPMPKSWSKKKKKEMEGAPHTSRPDLDNLLKSIFDCHLHEDSHVHAVGYLSKIWGKEGAILIHLRQDDLPW